MTDTPIRTFSTIVGDSDARSRDLAGFLPADWEPGTPVLVVAGLPAGAELVAHGPGDDGYDGLANGWEVAASIIAPKPVPAPAAAAREIAADELRVAEQHGCGFTDIGPTAVADRIIDRLTVAGLLVDPAPTGDDEPAGCGTCTRCKHGIGGCMTEPADAMSEHTCDDCAGPGEPQEDTPTTEGQWEVDDYGDESSTVRWCFGKRQSLEPWEALPGTAEGQAAQAEFDAAYDALVELVRRDGTAPDLPSVAQVTNQIAKTLRHSEFPRRSVEVVLAAVRALRDGAER